MIKDLNIEQIAAIQQKGNVLLTACPGSGKTRTIIYKLAHEVEQLEPGSKKRIVALTFTLRASEEIFNRLNKIGINSRKIWSGTLHAFCLEWILKPYSCYSPQINNGYSIADETFCSDLITELKTKHGLKSIDSVNLRFDRNGNFTEDRPLQKKVLEEYHETLKKNKLIDFDLILLYSFQILKSNPKISKNLSNIFKLICVDEYQDTQDLLYAVISSIINAGKGKTTLFLVGDTDQAIYASLGGVAKSLEDIQTETNGMPIAPLTLSGNYRSNQRIIDFYSHFQIEKKDIHALGKNAAEKGIITLNTSIDASDIVTEIARLIKISLDKGIPESEICVLVPQWWLITSISKQLRAILPNVNFDASGLTPMSKNRENIWYKLSRLFLTEPNPKIYSLRYKWAAEIIEEFEKFTFTNFIDKYNNAKSLLRLINSIKSTENEGIEYLNDCFGQFLNAVEIEYINYPQLNDNRQQFFDNIQKRLNDPVFKIESDIQTFKSFYREMTGIVINTCVGVKGEEFETVIAYGLLFGYIPHWNEYYAGNAVSASKKLMYVICSRAKTNLHLISETGRTTKKGEIMGINPELGGIEFTYDLI